MRVLALADDRRNPCARAPLDAPVAKVEHPPPANSLPGTQVPLSAAGQSCGSAIPRLPAARWPTQFRLLPEDYAAASVPNPRWTLASLHSVRRADRVGWCASLV